MNTKARLFITAIILLNCFVSFSQNGGAIRANWLGPNKPTPPPKPREEYLDPNLAGTNGSQRSQSSYSSTAAQNLEIYNRQKQQFQNEYDILSNGLTAIADIFRKQAASKHIRGIQNMRAHALAAMEAKIESGRYKVEQCQNCSGSGLMGHKPCSGTGKTNCSLCSGTGKSFNGSSCTYCQGSGASYCSSGCSGTGVFDCRSCSATGMFLKQIVVKQRDIQPEVTFTQAEENYNPDAVDYALDSLWEKNQTTLVRIRQQAFDNSAVEVLVSFQDGSEPVRYIIPRGESNKPANKSDAPTVDGIIITENWDANQKYFVIAVRTQLMKLASVEIDPNVMLREVNRRNNLLTLKW